MSQITKVKEVSCIVCGAGLAKSTHVYKEFDLDIVRCSICGLVYVNPRLADEELDIIYGKNQVIDHGADVREDKTRNRQVFVRFETKLAQQRLHRVAKIRDGKLGRILDIGCQHGLFLNLARQAGWEPTGVEMTTEFAENARREYSLEVFNEKIENVDFAGRRFDFVTLLDVFEHVQDPNAVLTAIKRSMASDGILLIKVPNVTFIILKTFVLSVFFGKDAHTRHDFVNPLGYWMAQEHLYNFSDRTLQKLLSKNGFRTIRSFNEFPSIYGAHFWRDAVQVGVWVGGFIIRTLTFGRVNVGRSLLYAFSPA